MPATSNPDDQHRTTVPSRKRRGRLAMAGLTIIFAVGIVVVAWIAWSRHEQKRWFQAGLAAISSGDNWTLQQAASHMPSNSTQSSLLQGAIKLRSNQPDLALPKLQAAAHDPRTAVMAHFLAGEALCRLQSYHAAMQTLQGALEQDPNDVDGHRWLGVAAYEVGATSLAADQMREVLRLAPQDSRAYRMLGLIFMEAENFPQAISAYQASLRSSRNQPDHEQIVEELATAQLRVHRFEDVLSTLAESPSSPELDSLKAEALYSLGRSNEAVGIVDTVLRIKVTHRALIVKGLTLLDEGHPLAAIEPFRQAVQQHPEDFETRAKLTQAYSQAGNQEAAQRELKEFERIKSVRESIHELTLKVAQNPDDAELRFELGQQYRTLGLIAVALKWYRAALGLDPTHVAARNAVRELSELTGSSNRN